MLLTTTNASCRSDFLFLANLEPLFGGGALFECLNTYCLYLFEYKYCFFYSGWSVRATLMTSQLLQLFIQMPNFIVLATFGINTKELANKVLHITMEILMFMLNFKVFIFEDTPISYWTPSFQFNDLTTGLT